MIVDVIEREILVNSLWMVHDEPCFKVLAGDLRSKYAQFGGMLSQHGNTLEFFLEADERTLYTGAESGMTEVILRLEDAASWHVSVDVARYSLYVSMWRVADNLPVTDYVWETMRDVSRETR